jgi:tRNA(Ile)-lysidine synthase
MPGVSPGPLDPAAIFAPLDEFPRLGLAVSGGADSLALMLLAARYAADPEARRRFFVYSVDHGLRPEAADEVAFVVAEAEKLGMHARPLRWEGEKPATGIQQAARKARYTLIAEAMDADEVPVLLTAHHMVDQAETVLMRLAHGSGIEGLRGMDYFSEVNGIAIVRPLLGVDPVALAQVVATAGLAPVGDPSNLDNDFERVRWRHALPQLAALGIDSRRLSRFADRMRDADLAIAAMANTVEFEAGIGSRTLGHRILRDLPRAVAVKVMQRLLREVGAGLKPHDLARIEAITDALRGQLALKRTSLHGCLVSSDGTSITVEREPGRRVKAEARATRGPRDA